MDVITTHINADFDCLGGMIAAKKLYPDAAMVFAGAQERSLREFFMQSACYAYEFKRIKDIDLEDITRLILVDVCQAERIGPFGEVAKRPGVEVHIYDHHPNKPHALRGTVEEVRSVGSTVTVLTHIFMERGIHPNADEATMMLLGLYEDTSKLLSHATSSADYQAAAYLVEHGGNLNTVSDFLVQELTSDQVALLHELLQSLTAINVNSIDVHVAHASVDDFVGDLAVLAHKIKDMHALNALFVAVRMGDRIFMVGRSRLPEVSAGEILEEFGGGGHAFASSATVKDLTLVQVLDKLPVVLRRHVNPHWEARHIMFSPVKSVQKADTIAQVREILTRYNINAMPVLDGDRVVGIITRQVVEKAAHHLLEDIPVSEYMSSDFSSVTPDTALQTLQELIVGRHQRFVPVVEDDGQLVGALTRTDLLHHLVSGAVARRRQGIGDPGNGLTLKKRTVAHLLRNQLRDSLQKTLSTIGAVGDALGRSVFVVGGFVRDLLLRQENFDVDIVVEGDGIAFAEEYARRYDCRVRAHKKFATAVLIFADGFKVDVASARTEYYLEPGALPTVENASIKLDLYRRDFTINTLAIALNGPHFGELLDYFGGQNDLRGKAIRVLHNLSFVEDPTRMFRAIRFEQRLGFQMGRHTVHLLKSAVRMGFLDKISGPRVFNELVLIFRESDPLPAMRRLDELGLLAFIHPTLSVRHLSDGTFAAAKQAVDWYELLYTGERCQRWKVFFLCLLSDLDHGEVQQIVQRLAMPPQCEEFFGSERDAATRILNQIEWRSMQSYRWRDSDIHALLKDLPVEALLYGMAITEHEEARRTISHFITHLRHVKCLLRGHDLQSLGLAPGPIYREIFDALLDVRLDGQVVTREDELQFVTNRYVEKIEEKPSR
ncbi:adenosine-specific tRNA nucleotidyltransferase [Syntrophotalea carbinolica DSM 2380]|uniref:Adenosine-specific tRNA nucleotidyltransferase n=1 Tax=Syntrophotalea carbinolica (strain DSM 2380 / NBRC 103641 / GraBd1) TaxID=338963 RepID=Q3A511_SYNC1|nr:CBS domain-containing protein [Syntrophotalea carbinolica]ABA88546.1 adenosine-specific tRNA nucleotidyltransferase [Syntrophotalea carbinolica DSM 2380]